MIRRLAAVTVLASAATLTAALAPATAAPLPLPPVHHAPDGPTQSLGGQLLGAPSEAAPDSLTVTVSKTGQAADQRTYRLKCHPVGGNHPNAQGACDQLDENTEWGKDAFAATPKNQKCTMIHGGPETAHVEGTWQGRPVDADFERSNGCEIARWDKLSEVLDTAR
ncbi:hypothetical protein HCC30_24135 [Streptomyces sp. HNM0574]|nr:SSI family serine proteinase inhibitor [Streptomyces sp. HNM0574]NLU70320.1 hypothetical protein [Streptomyces sp. HNM0574]